jgi:pilus assembly protein FimV
MSMRSIRRWVLGVGLVLGCGPAGFAIGLGPIHSKTAINQYFYATIPVTSQHAGTFRSLKVRLAGYRQFKKSGLAYPPVLLGFRFHLEKMPNGQHDIVVTSDQPIRRPFLVFLLDVHWPSGRLMREYTVLLNPPLIASARPAPRIRETPLPSSSRAAVATVASAPPQAAPPRRLRRSPRTLGPVRVGQTLWTISRRQVSNPARIDQMMLAVYRRNPYAFFGNINRLRAGADLRIPPARDIRAIPLRSAIAFVKAQDREWRATAVPSRSASSSPRLVLLSPSRLRSTRPTASAASAVVTRLRQRIRGEHARVAGLTAAVKNQKAEIARLKNLLTLKNQALVSLEHAAPHRTPLRSASVLPSFLWILIAGLVILTLGWLWIRRRSGRAERMGSVALPRQADARAAGAGEGAEPVEMPLHESAVPEASDLEPVESGTADEASFDPFTEVKFQMAYGLYDRAIETLSSWLEQNPDRQEVQLKLLEVYAMAGRNQDYVALARGYQSRFGTDDAHWPEIAEQGRQVAPGERLFDVVALPVPGASGTRSEPASVATGTENIEHYFDELMGTPETSVETPAADLSPPGTAAPSTLHRESDIGTDTSINTEINLEFELAAFTPSGPSQDKLANGPQAPGSAGGRSRTDSRTLDSEAQRSFDESIAAITQHTATLTVSGLGSGTETVATKIDLARAYLEMGDKDSAKSILDEVLEEGSLAQKTQAREILATLPNS